MIIDSHVHIGKTEKSERVFTFKTFEKLMKKSGVGASVVMPNISSIDTSFNLNEVFLQLYSKEGYDNKEIYYPFLLIDPNRIDTLRQIESYRYRIFGVKFHPSVCQVVANDDKLDPFYKFLEEKKLPIIIHCGRDNKSHINHVVIASKKYPKVNFIAAHLGGNATDLVEKALDILQRENTNNIYLDTSANKLPWLIEQAVQKVGIDKIIFGSDEPYADIRVSLYCTNLASIKGKDLLFSDNIKKLLGV